MHSERSSSCLRNVSSSENRERRASHQEPVVRCCTEAAYHTDYSPGKLFHVADEGAEDLCAHCSRPKSSHHTQQLDSWATSAALLYSGILKLSTMERPAKQNRPTTTAEARHHVFCGVDEHHLVVDALGTRMTDMHLPDYFLDVQGGDGNLHSCLEVGPCSLPPNTLMRSSYLLRAPWHTLLGSSYHRYERCAHCCSLGQCQPRPMSTTLQPCSKPVAQS